MASASTPEDTIRVQQRMAAVEISSDDEPLQKEDDVEEYDFSEEPDEDDKDYEDDGLDTAHLKYPNGTLPISSDDEDESKAAHNWAPPDRAWRSKDFGIGSRHAYEMMFFEIPDRPMPDINGAPDWDVTEDYMRERDHEMLRYLEDYPLPQWVIAQAKATDAYSRLMERVRWRSLGIRIYRSNNMPGFGGMGTQPFQSVTNQVPSGMMQSRHSSQSMPSGRPGGAGYVSGAHHGHTPTLSGNGSMHGMPGRAANGVAPSPSAVLRSQPDAQPVQLGPNGVPNNPSPTPADSDRVQSPSASAARSYHGSTYAAHAHHAPVEPRGNKGKARARLATPPFLPLDAISSRIPTPPYEVRPKPPERRVALNARRKNQNLNRKMDNDTFPWNREGIDFKLARVNAVWNDDIYAEATLQEMDATRARNTKIIARVDLEAGQPKKANAAASSDAEPPKKQDRRRISASKAKAGEPGTNEQHAGSYNFASVEDAQKANKFSKLTPDETMLAYEDGEISLDACAEIHIYWNAGKKSSMAELEPVRFSVKDSILTRQQINTMPVLTHQAAERIVDFCPDLVWRDMLLRIVSEAGYGNKETRDRLCHNGSYVDKATITKRVGAALGQKQLQTAMKKRIKHADNSSDPAVIRQKQQVEEEQRYYDANTLDFSNYMEFFGHRSSHRNQVKIDGARKRKLESLDREGSSGVEEMSSSPRKRTRAEKGSVQSPLAAMSSDDTTGAENETEEESEAHPDAVSVQSDTILDEMDED